MKDKNLEIYWAKGWVVTFVAGFVLDALLILKGTCISEYVYQTTFWWNTCRIFPARNFANLGDIWAILAFAFLGGCICWFYGSVKSKRKISGK
jgi:hypothetical protein